MNFQQKINNHIHSELISHPPLNPPSYCSVSHRQQSFADYEDSTVCLIVGERTWHYKLQEAEPTEKTLNM